MEKLVAEIAAKKAELDRLRNRRRRDRERIVSIGCCMRV